MAFVGFPQRWSPLPLRLLPEVAAVGGRPRPPLHAAPQHPRVGHRWQRRGPAAATPPLPPPSPPPTPPTAWLSSDLFSALLREDEAVSSRVAIPPDVAAASPALEERALPPHLPLPARPTNTTVFFVAPPSRRAPAAPVVVAFAVDHHGLTLDVVWAVAAATGVPVAGVSPALTAAGWLLHGRAEVAPPVAAAGVRGAKGVESGGDGGSWAYGLRQSGLRLEHGLLLTLGPGVVLDAATIHQLQSVVGLELRARPPRPSPVVADAWARVTIVPPLPMRSPSSLLSLPTHDRDCGGGGATVVRVGVAEALLTSSAAAAAAVAAALREGKVEVAGADLPASLASTIAAAAAAHVTSTTVAVGVGGAGRVELAFVVGPTATVGSPPVPRRLAKAALRVLRAARSAAMAAAGDPRAQLWVQMSEGGTADDAPALLVAEAVWVDPTDAALDARAFGRYATPNLRGRAPEVPYEWMGEPAEEAPGGVGG
ncbi:hypothetical protein MMPV_006509 [Pyropia vietnamensis]